MWHGADAVLKATAYIERLVAAGRGIREVVFDPMRFSSEALRLERDHGLTLVEWPQSETRMTICSERLHGLVIEQRLRHPGVAELTATSPTPSRSRRPEAGGWSSPPRPRRSTRVIALAMAAERAAQTVPETKFHGWL